MTNNCKQSKYFACCNECNQKDWCRIWENIENCRKSGYYKTETSSIGFDLFYVAHGLRDCLLIDHLLWRQQKMHSQLLISIEQNKNAFECTKRLNHFYFDKQLFIINSNKFKQRVLNDNIQHIFVNISSSIEKPIICNKTELSFIHSSLKYFGLLLSQTLFNNKCDNKCKRSNDGFKCKKRRHKRHKRYKKPNKSTSNHIDISQIDKNLFPTICGYLLNYLFIYFTNDIQSNCLNQHKLRLFKFKLDQNCVIQFSAPQNIIDTIENDVMPKYCKRLSSMPLAVSNEIVSNNVTL